MRTVAVSLLFSAAAVDTFGATHSSPPSWTKRALDALAEKAFNSPNWNGVKEGPNALSTPEFWDTNWEAQNNREKLVSNSPGVAAMGASAYYGKSQWFNTHHTQLSPHRAISKGSGDGHVKLERDQSQEMDRRIENFHYTGPYGLMYPRFATTRRQYGANDLAKWWENQAHDASCSELGIQLGKLTLPFPIGNASFRCSNAKGKFIDLLNDASTDGIMIMQNGKVVYEKYFGDHKEGKFHKVYSVTKSITGILTQMLIDDPKYGLHETDLLDDILPSLKGSGFEGATLRDALGMRVPIHMQEAAVEHQFVDDLIPSMSIPKEVSTDPSAILNEQNWDEHLYAPIREAAAAAMKDAEDSGTFKMTYPTPKSALAVAVAMNLATGANNFHPLIYQKDFGVPFNPGPQNLFEFMPFVPRNPFRKPGDFQYQTAVTQVLGWVADETLRKHGSSLFQYFEDEIWSKLGADNPAMMNLDGSSIGQWGSGLSLTLPDMARVGEMMLDGGKNKRKEQVVPPKIVEDLKHPKPEFMPNNKSATAWLPAKSWYLKKFYNDKTKVDPSDGYIDMLYGRIFENADPCDNNYYNQIRIGTAKGSLQDRFANETNFYFQGVYGQLVRVYPYLNMTVAIQRSDPQQQQNIWPHFFNDCTLDFAFQQLGAHLLGLA